MECNVHDDPWSYTYSISSVCLGIETKIFKHVGLDIRPVVVSSTATRSSVMRSTMRVTTSVEYKSAKRSFGELQHWLTASHGSFSWLYE